MRHLKYYLNVLIQSPKGCWCIEWVILIRETSPFFFSSSETVKEMGSWPSQPQDCVSFGVWLCSMSWFLELPDSSQRKAMGSNKLFSLHLMGIPSHWIPRAVRFRLEMCCPQELLTKPATLSGGPNFLEAQWWLPVSVLGERKSLKNPFF